MTRSAGASRKTVCYHFEVRAHLLSALLLTALVWPAGSGPAELELVNARRVYAPAQAIQVRLTNRGTTPVYFMTEVRSGVRTQQGSRLPGLPVYERRRLKWPFRSERWVYATNEHARFRAATLAPNDSVVFTVNFSRPDKYKVHVAYWRQEDIGNAEAFLNLGVQEISKRYGNKLRWTSTPSFRIAAPTPAPPVKK